MCYLPVVLPAQFGGTVRRKGEVILEAGSFSWLPETVFGTLKIFFIILLSFLFFIMKWEGKNHRAFSLVLCLFCYIFWKFCAHWHLLPMCVYSM